MARGRMLNKSVSASVKINNLSDDTCRLLATWIIPHLDVRGVFYGDPAMVRSAIFPRRTDITIEQVEDYLQELCDAGLVEIFQANGDTWQYWTGFAHNQVGLRIDRESSEFPVPPGYSEPDNQQDDGNLPDDSRNDDGELPAEDKEKLNVSLSEKKDNIPPKACATAQTPPPTPEKAPKSKPKPKTTPLTDGAKEFLRLFSAKRFSNAAQRSAILELERQFPVNFLPAATWAAEKGVARGQAIAMMRKALPNWNHNDGRTNGNKDTASSTNQNRRARKGTASTGKGKGPTLEDPTPEQLAHDRALIEAHRAERASTTA